MHQNDDTAVDTLPLVFNVNLDNSNQIDDYNIIELLDIELLANYGSDPFVHTSNVETDIDNICQYNSDVFLEPEVQPAYPADLNELQVTQPEVPLEVPTVQLSEDDTNKNKSDTKKRRKRRTTRKAPTEPRVYKCEMCTFTSKYKTSLQFHCLRHKQPSELKMFKCDKCQYQTKRKYCLKVHELHHTDPSKVEMYECDICGFSTKYKRNFGLHQMKHNMPWEEPI